MFPHRLTISGLHLEIWDIALLVGTMVGYFVVRAAFELPSSGAPGRPRWLLLRYILVAYIAVLAAQLFSYAFDRGTTLLPPRTMSRAYYYLSPVAGAKTLYGVLAALPLAIALVSLPWRRERYVTMLDRWTPATFAVLAFARLGCFLQGCCYGVRSEIFGLRFAEGSVVYHAQVGGALIESGAPALAVVPTQGISAVVLAVLSVWTYRRLAAGDRNVFPVALAVYSVFRFLIELIRDDPVRNQLGPFSTSQWIALAVLGVCLGVYATQSGRVRSA